jgi:hypothetical protein
MQQQQRPAAELMPVARLLGKGDEVYLTPQNFIEFWAVATRPRAENGLGMKPEETTVSLRNWYESFFQFAPDSPAVHATWERLVTEFGVCGKPVHDAAIVAAAKAAGADQVLQFNR